MLSLRTNYRFQDMLLNEAARAEARGDTDLASSKLDDALAADTVLEKSRNRIRKKVICVESVLEFIDEFGALCEPVDYSDMPEYRFALITQKTKRVKRMELKRLNATVSPRTNTKKEDEI
jgi:hypothetical protein